MIGYCLAIDVSGNAGVVNLSTRKVVSFDQLDSALRVLAAVKQDASVFDKFYSFPIDSKWNRTRE